MANPEHLAILEQGAEVWNKWRDDNPTIQPDLKACFLKDYNLSKINFSYTNLCEALILESNLIEATFYKANLTNANLGKSRADKAYFVEANLEKASLPRTRLIDADLSRAKLNFAILRKANLTNVNLFLTDLTKANLTKANLTGASLYCTQLAKADLQYCTLTRALIEDCNINSADLSHVICEYIYLRHNEKERLPHDRNFKLGEFSKIFQQPRNILEILFQDGINWKAFASAFNKSNIEIYDTTGKELYLREYKNYEGGLIILKVKVPEGVNKQKIKNNLCHEYQIENASLQGEIKAKNETLALLERMLLPSSLANQTVVNINEKSMFEKERILVLKTLKEEIETKGSIKDSKLSKNLNMDIHEVRVYLRQLKNSGLIKTIEHKQHQDPTQPKIDLVLVTEITSEGYLTLRNKIPISNSDYSNPIITINNGNMGIGHMSGGKIQDHAKISGSIDEIDEKEINQLLQDLRIVLKELEQTYNPNTTTGKMTIATKAIEHIEQDSNLAKRVLSALEKGGTAWLQAKLINPSASFLVAALEDWQKNKQ